MGWGSARGTQLGRRKGPILSRVTKSVWVEVAAPGGVPKPAPVPRCPGQLPAPARHRTVNPGHHRQKQPESTGVARRGTGRSPPLCGVGFGGLKGAHTHTPAPPSTISPGAKRSCPVFWQSPPPQKISEFAESSTALGLPAPPQLQPTAPASGQPPPQDERLRPKSLHQGQDEASRGAPGGHGAPPAAVAPTHKRFGGWEARGGRCARAPSAHPRCCRVSCPPPASVPVPHHPGGDGEGAKPQPKALNAGLGVS